MGAIGPTQLIIVLVIVLLVFGTKKLKNLGSDLGGALKGFKNAMDEGEEKADEEKKTNGQISESAEGETIDVTAEPVEKVDEEK